MTEAVEAVQKALIQETQAAGEKTPAIEEVRIDK